MDEPGCSAANMLSLLPKSSELHIAMTIGQVCYAGIHVIVRTALNTGMSKLVFPVYRNIIALLVLAPFSYFLEKKDRPALTISILVQFFFIGLVGITLNQGLYLYGLDNTSPTFASATENAVPAVTFILATFLRLEQVHMNRRDGIAKVLGTLISFVGASVITLYKGPTIFGLNSASNGANLFMSLGDAKAKNWTLGCICCFGHCVCWSCWIVLQANVLKKYPARFSVYSFTCFFAILQFLAVAAYVERDSYVWQIHSASELFSLFYAALAVSGIYFGIQIWVIQKGGPVFVSGYMPLQTMLVAVMSSIALSEEFYLGGIIGTVLIIIGLYMVLWGKSEESKLETTNDDTPSVSKKSSKCSLVQPLLPTVGQ